MDKFDSTRSIVCTHKSLSEVAGTQPLFVLLLWLQSAPSPSPTPQSPQPVSFGVGDQSPIQSLMVTLGSALLTSTSVVSPVPTRKWLM